MHNAVQTLAAISSSAVRHRTRNEALMIQMKIMSESATRATTKCAELAMQLKDRQADLLSLARHTSHVISNIKKEHLNQSPVSLAALSSSAARHRARYEAATLHLQAATNSAARAKQECSGLMTRLEERDNELLSVKHHFSLALAAKDEEQRRAFREAAVSMAAVSASAARHRARNCALMIQLQASTSATKRAQDKCDLLSDTQFTAMVEK